MKRIFYTFFMVCTVFIISSCTIYGHCIRSYNFTFWNNTTSDVCDWYLKNSDNFNIAKSDYSVFVHPLNSSTIYNVPMDTYRVYFAYNSNKEQYYYSDSFFLNSNKTFYLSNASIHSRAINTNAQITKDSNFYIQDDEGNMIQLYLAEK